MHHRLGALVACLLAVLVYSNSLRSGFVLDNRVLILDDPRLKAASAQNVELIFNRSYWWPYGESNLYRPATTLSYLVNYSVLGSGEQPAGYHVVNLLIHVVNVALFYYLLQSLLTMGTVQLTDSRLVTGPLLAAALWAVHPLTTEAVTNIVGRADLLAATGTLAALLAHAHASVRERSRRWRWRLLELLGITLAVFSKESGIVAVPLIVLYDLVLPRPETQHEARSGKRQKRTGDAATVRADSIAAQAAVWAILCAPLVAFAYFRSAAIPAVSTLDPFVDNPIAGAPFGIARLTALAVMGRYVWLALWPRTLSSDYSFNQVPLASGTPTEIAAWLTAAGVIAFTAFLIVRKYRLASFLAAFAFIAFLPASNLFFATGTIMAERLMYLPLVGFLGLVVLAFYAAVTRFSLTPIAAPATLIIGVLVLGVKTWERNRDWRDDVSLWTSAVHAAPASFKAHKGLADSLYDADPSRANIERVVAEAERSIAILDGLPDAANVPAAYRRAAGFHVDLGDRLANDNVRPTDVEVSYKRAAALTERYIAILRALPPGGFSKPAEAESARATELGDAYQLLSAGYLRVKDSGRAIEAARQAQELRPFDVRSYLVSAAALAGAQRVDDAAAQLLTGVMLTGDAELRQGAIDLFRKDPDPNSCGLKRGYEGMVLDPTCERVRRALCRAAAEAARIQRQANRLELAEQANAMAATYRCQ